MKKERVLTDQQQLFLDALTPCKGNIRQAMKIAGYADTTSERYVINTLHEEIVEVANKLLASSSVQAAVAIKEVLDNPAEVGNQHKINAAKEILDRGGVIKKSQDDVKVDGGGGILILPAKKVKIEITDE